MDIYKNGDSLMQRIKTFRTFESVTPGLTPEQESWLDECTKGTWSLNAEGLVDMKGDFNCSNKRLSDFKGVRFGKVSGYFWCSYNNLTSLVGAPREVGLVFWCNNNSLTSLEGAPLEVDGHFECENNPLKTLAGAPQKIRGSFKFSAGVGAPEFYISKGQWGPDGWLQALKTIGDPKARALVLTLLDPDTLNKRFSEQPEQTMIDLQGVWNLPEFAPIRKQLKVPERYRDDMDLLGDMKELGF
jgi:hypothetical protein